MPITHGWNYLVQLYRPRPEILDGAWSFPKLTSWQPQQLPPDRPRWHGTAASRHRGDRKRNPSDPSPTDYSLVAPLVIGTLILIVVASVAMIVTAFLKP